MRMDVPSEHGGARTLPAELRTPNIPRGNAWGWHRLHANLTPVTETALSGLGADATMIPVDPVPMPPVSVFPAYSGGGMPTYIQSLISQGLITPTIPGKPPNAPPGSRLQRTPWGYMWAHIVKTQNGPVITWMSERPEVLTQGVSGLGSCVDPSAWDYNPADCMAPTDTSGGVSESPYPVVFSDGSTGSLSATDWTNIINSSSNALTRMLAVTQGGSVSASGNIYGSPQTATVAAGFPQNQLSVTGAGVAGALSSPMILLLVGAVVLMMVAKK